MSSEYECWACGWPIILDPGGNVECPHCNTTDLIDDLLDENEQQ